MSKTKYCVECGKEKRVAIFMNDPWCSENCRKSMKKEGPKVGFSQEFFDRNRAAGIFLDLHDIQNWKRVLDYETSEDTAKHTIDVDHETFLEIEKELPNEPKLRGMRREDSV